MPEIYFDIEVYSCFLNCSFEEGKTFWLASTSNMQLVMQGAQRESKLMDFMMAVIMKLLTINKCLTKIMFWFTFFRMTKDHFVESNEIESRQWLYLLFTTNNVVKFSIQIFNIYFFFCCSIFWYVSTSYKLVYY